MCHGVPTFVVKHKGTWVSCPCKQVARARARIRQIAPEVTCQLDPALTFERFQASESVQARALELCRAWAAQPKDWIVLCGPTGVGKTHLATATAREAWSEGYAVLMADKLLEMQAGSPGEQE